MQYSTVQRNEMYNIYGQSNLRGEYRGSLLYLQRTDKSWIHKDIVHLFHGLWFLSRCSTCANSQTIFNNCTPLLLVGYTIIYDVHYRGKVIHNIGSNTTHCPFHNYHLHFDLSWFHIFSSLGFSVIKSLCIVLFTFFVYRKIFHITNHDTCSILLIFLLFF